MSINGKQGNTIKSNYHAIVTKNELSRNLLKLMPDIVNKLEAAFEDEIVIGHGMSLLGWLK